MSNLALKLAAGAARIADRSAAITDTDAYYYVVDRVAAYKYPHRIWFVDTLPTGPTGKLLRREAKPPPEEA